MKKVLIVDDQESMRRALEQEFCPGNGFEVVGSIASSADADLFCFKFSPELVITDVSTAGGASGLDAVAIIRERYPAIKIIVTSGFDEVTNAPRAKELGAHAFIYKSKSIEYFVKVAARVLSGETVFPETRKTPAISSDTPFIGSELEVLQLLCRHMTSKEIGKELCLSEDEVDRMKSDMLAKSGLETVFDLVFQALSAGWISQG